MMNRNLLLICLLLAGWLLRGQSDGVKPENQRRFQVMAGAGIPAGGYYRQGLEAMTYLPATVHFRVRKWMDVGLRIGYQSSSTAAATFDQWRISAQTVRAVYARHERAILIGPELRGNYRVGQGDLSLLVGVGLAAKKAVFLVDGPTVLEPLTFQFEPYRQGYTHLGLQYTYWAGQRWGLSGALIHQHHFEAFSPQPEDGTPRRMPLATVEGSAGASGESLNALVNFGQVTTTSMVTFELGLVFRPF